MKTTAEQNKRLVLKAFDTLFNERDYAAADRFWSPHYIVADGDFVMVHGRFSGFQPVSWIAADILRIEDGVLVEHWDVIQDEATEAQSKSKAPMFGARFPR
jgi:predicted SnoaL-like aldol condensation-catalyzing enzyme